VRSFKILCDAYVNGIAVTGSIMDGSGHLGIMTAAVHRRKGYAQVCLQHLVRKLREAGITPCSIVNIGNSASHDLHLKTGFQIIGRCDFVTFKG